MDWRGRLSQFMGWHVVYSNQCPYHVKAVEDMGTIAQEFGIKLQVHELKTAEQAQQAPSVFATFNVIHDGELLEDHYISGTRFKNILKKRVT
jgi:hypothetical protein